MGKKQLKNNLQDIMSDLEFMVKQLERIDEWCCGDEIESALKHLKNVEKLLDEKK